MKKEYHRRKDENLAQWIERLVPAMLGKGLAEVHDIVTAVSKESYFAGAHAEREVARKYGGLNR